MLAKCRFRLIPLFEPKDEVLTVRFLLLVTAMLFRGGILRVAGLIFLGFCLLALGAIVLGH